MLELIFLMIVRHGARLFAFVAARHVHDDRASEPGLFLDRDVVHAPDSIRHSGLQWRRDTVLRGELSRRGAANRSREIGARLPLRSAFDADYNKGKEILILLLAY